MPRRAPIANARRDVVVRRGARDAVESKVARRGGAVAFVEVDEERSSGASGGGAEARKYAWLRHWPWLGAPADD